MANRKRTSGIIIDLTNCSPKKVTSFWGDPLVGGCAVSHLRVHTFGDGSSTPKVTSQFTLRGVGAALSTASGGWGWGWGGGGRARAQHQLLCLEALVHGLEHS